MPPMQGVETEQVLAAVPTPQTGVTGQTVEGQTQVPAGQGCHT